MMSSSPIRKYFESLHEGIAEEIIKLLLLRKLKPALKAAEKQLHDDPEFVAQLDAIKYATEKFENTLKHWCKHRPEDRRCKDKKF